MTRRSAPKAPPPQASALGSLASSERSKVLDALLSAHPELNDETERIACDLLAAVSVGQVATEVESALVSIPVDALGARAGRVRGRGYVHETEAAYELVNEVIEPFRLDLARRTALGLLDPAAKLVVGIVAGIYRARDPEDGTVRAYAGEDTPIEIATDVLDRAAELGVRIPDGAPSSHWPRWPDLS